jgi:peroxiredoxin
MQQIHDEWRDRGVVVLTIDIIGSRPTETPSNLAKFMQDNNYSFPVLLDTDRAVTASYGVASTPTNFLIDRDGVIREVRVGSFPSKTALEDSLTRLLSP